jgi:hypothetical protein
MLIWRHTTECNKALGPCQRDSLLKLPYAGIFRVDERCTHPIQNWNLTLSKFSKRSANTI